MDNMDYEYCFRKGIHVLATSPVFAQPVAEMAMGLTLSIARSIHIAHLDFISKKGSPLSSLSIVLLAGSLISGSCLAVFKESIFSFSFIEETAEAGGLSSGIAMVSIVEESGF